MTYPDAINLIGLPVQNKKSRRLYKVLDVSEQSDKNHVMHLSGGQLIPIETMDDDWQAVEGPLL